MNKWCPKINQNTSRRWISEAVGNRYRKTRETWAICVFSKHIMLKGTFSSRDITFLSLVKKIDQMYESQSSSCTQMLWAKFRLIQLNDTLVGVQIMTVQRHHTRTYNSQHLQSSERIFSFDSLCTQCVWRCPSYCPGPCSF